jgi:CheY-like chemotaxis protein
VSDVLWGKLFDAIAAVAWVLFATAVYLSLRRPLLERILPRVSTVKGLGIELTLARELLDKASESAGDSGSAGPTVTARERRGVLRRLDHAAPYLRDGRILWVDDHPENNRYLIQLFEQSGMTVDLARSTDEALQLLVGRHRAYDLVLSDIRRGDDAQAGMRMLEVFRKHGIRLPVVLHSAGFDSRLGLDPMVFAATNRIDEVVHYVIDLMERARIAADG